MHCNIFNLPYLHYPPLAEDQEHFVFNNGIVVGFHAKYKSAICILFYKHLLICINDCKVRVVLTDS